MKLNLPNVVFNIIRAVCRTEEYNLDIVLSDKNNVVIHERHCTLDQYTWSNVLRLKREIDELGNSE